MASSERWTPTPTTRGGPSPRRRWRSCGGSPRDEGAAPTTISCPRRPGTLDGRMPASPRREIVNLKQEGNRAQSSALSGGSAHVMRLVVDYRLGKPPAKAEDRGNRPPLI